MRKLVIGVQELSRKGRAHGAENAICSFDDSYTNDPAAKREMAKILGCSVCSLDIVKKDMSGIGEVKSSFKGGLGGYAAYSIGGVLVADGVQLEFPLSAIQKAEKHGINVVYWLTVVDKVGHVQEMISLSSDELLARMLSPNLRISARIDMQGLETRRGPGR